MAAQHPLHFSLDGKLPRVPQTKPSQPQGGSLGASGPRFTISAGNTLNKMTKGWSGTCPEVSTVPTTCSHTGLSAMLVLIPASFYPVPQTSESWCAPEPVRGLHHSPLVISQDRLRAHTTVKDQVRMQPLLLIRTGCLTSQSPTFLICKMGTIIALCLIELL